MLAVIGERHILEPNLPAGADKRPSVGAFDHFRQLIEQRESPFHAAQVALQSGGPRADRLQRSVELPDVRHDQQQVAHRQNARLDVTHSDPQHRRHAERRGHPDHERVVTLDQRHPIPGLDARPAVIQIALLLVVLAAEPFHHAYDAEHLLDD